MLKKFFEYYGFSKVEQRGFLVLAILLVLLLLAQVLYDYFDSPRSIAHAMIPFPETEAMEDSDPSSLEPSSAPIYEHRGNQRRPISYFTFDPNELSAEKWQELGFSAKQVAVIKNYQAKGGRFYKKEDVAKLYVVSERDYARIAPYIVIKPKEITPKERDTFVPKEKNSSVTAPLSIDINAADTSEFKRLRGIGSVLATRTVRYREALGGFHDISQIGEVYGISAELLESLRSRLQISNTHITKLNINTATAEELSKHPYISRKQAQLITNYRKQHGLYQDISDLESIHALDEDFFRKIAPYIEI